MSACAVVFQQREEGGGGGGERGAEGLFSEQGEGEQNAARGRNWTLWPLHFKREAAL